MLDILLIIKMYLLRINPSSIICKQRKLVDLSRNLFSRRNFCQDTHDTEWMNYKGQIAGLLDSLENKKSIPKSSTLINAPRLCEIHGFGDRFVSVVDHWWTQILEASEDGKTLNDIRDKPTATVFHLGRLNWNHNGLVLKKLGPLEIEKLLNMAYGVDFRKLPERKDLLSFLHGIRDLIKDPKSRRVIYPELKPTSIGFYRNLEDYVKWKMSLEDELARAGIQNKDGTELSGHYKRLMDAWLFSVQEEAPSILLWFQEILIELETVRQNGDGLLTTLCQLCKCGFNHALEHCQSMRTNKKHEVRKMLFKYANYWIHVKCDPDEFLPQSLSTWYRLSDHVSPRSDDAGLLGKNLYRTMNYLKVFSEVACVLKKMDLFETRFRHWINDAQYCVKSFTNSKPNDMNITHSDYVECLLSTIYEFGELVKSLTHHQRMDEIDDFISLFYFMVDFNLTTTQPDSMNDLWLSRFLTSLRNVQLLTRRRRYSKQFAEKLLIFLNRYFNHKLNIISEDCFGENFHLNEIKSILESTTTAIFHLSRMRMRIDSKLWDTIDAIFESFYVGKSSQLFESDPRQFCTMLSNFGDACRFYRSICSEFELSDKSLAEYFIGARLVLENFERISPLFDADFVKRCTYTVGVIMNMGICFRYVKGFEDVKWIWQKRLMQIAFKIRTKDAFIISRNMRNMMTHYHVEFDPYLMDILHRRGKASEATSPHKLKSDMN